MPVMLLLRVQQLPLHYCLQPLPTLMLLLLLLLLLALLLLLLIHFPRLSSTPRALRCTCSLCLLRLRLAR